MTGKGEGKDCQDLPDEQDFSQKTAKGRERAE
jgi:hypothetical protein